MHPPHRFICCRRSKDPKTVRLDEELAQRTIFPFVIDATIVFSSLDDCRKMYRALARDTCDSVSAEVREPDAEIAAKVCLIGQPVALGQRGPHPVAALRICAGARLVTETWSSDADAARAEFAA